jgi:hypothetical protein
MTAFQFRSIDVSAAAGAYTYIGVTGVDAAGEIVGYYGNVDGDGDGTFHGFVAMPTSGAVTFDPPGSSNTNGISITMAGEIYGDYVDYANRQHGFIDNGTVNTFDFIPNQYTVLSGATDPGNEFGNFVDSFDTVRSFVEINGTFSIVSVAGSSSTSVSGINASGTIVGSYSDANYADHGFVIQNGVTTTVDAPNAYSTELGGVSASGLIVGNYEDLSSQTHAFIDNGGVVTTFNIAGSTSTSINAINGAGEFVGDYTDSSGNVHGFVDVNGSIALVDVPGAVDTNVLGLNDAGTIYGYYNDSAGQHGFVGAPNDAGPQTGPRVIFDTPQSNTFVGGSGLNTVVYLGPMASFNASAGANSSITVTGSGTDTLINIERLQFTDGVLAFDVQGDTGNAYRLYQAAFDRTPDTAGLSFWVHALDQGLNIQSVAQDFVDSSEFKSIYGTNPTNTQVVDLLYQNVLGRAGDTAGTNFWVDQLGAGTSLGAVLEGFAVSAEDHGLVDPVIAQGVVLNQHAFLV